MNFDALLGPSVICTTDGGMKMMHPGLPYSWGLLVAVSMLVSVIWALVAASPQQSLAAATMREGTNHRGLFGQIIRLPWVGSILSGYLQRLLSSRWLLLSLKLFMVGFFLMVIVAGLYGTPIAERNFATVLTWNLWWAGLVFSIFMFGSAWCAICPWDALAQWLVRRRLWKRATPNNSLNLKVPRYLNNVWPASLMFVGLTWLELGVGITINPYATAIVSLLMVGLATISLAVFQRKAFCKSFCPVGRTIGFYSQLAPVALRPIDPNVCAGCKTLDCYHGNAEVEPCPTSLVMGTLKQNTYCTSCGNCTQSCPHQNIAWRLRAPNSEAMQGARPHWDEAWFMVGLLALTGFHGITMMPFWEPWMSDLARMIGDSGRLLGSFTIGLILTLAVVIGFYALAVLATRFLTKTTLEFKRSFSAMAFVSLPIAFAYHMAHNLNHLIREGGGMWQVVTNPLGSGMLPLSNAEKHQRHIDMWLSQEVLYNLQAGLMILGFMVALQTLRHRGLLLMNENFSDDNLVFRAWQLSPMLIFVVVMSGFHLWMLMQPMIMRM